MIPDAVAGEKGRTVTFTAYKQNTNPPEIQPLTGSTMTGIIESIPGPNYTVRWISGTLAVSDGPNAQYTWTWNLTDTVAGDYIVQFIATIGANIIYKSFPEPWKVARSPATPV